MRSKINYTAGLDFQSGEPGGQGGAFRQIGDIKIAVFAVVNALGAILNRQGQVVRGHLERDTGTRSTLLEQAEKLFEPSAGDRAGRHTTLTLVVTNQKLNGARLTQLGRQVHSSLSRAIQPFHTELDGDTLFAVTTNEVENEKMSTAGLGATAALGAAAAELAWDAVLESFAD